jgi:hypothetical protein
MTAKSSASSMAVMMMMSNTNPLLDAVMRAIDTVNKRKHTAAMIYIDRYGDVDFVSYERDDDNEAADNYDYDYDFIERLSTLASQPFFEVLTFASDGTISHGSEMISCADTPAIAKALDEAIGQRKWFYDERVKQYGESALPITRWSKL